MNKEEIIIPIQFFVKNWEEYDGIMQSLPYENKQQCARFACAAVDGILIKFWITEKQISAVFMNGRLVGFNWAGIEMGEFLPDEARKRIIARHYLELGTKNRIPFNPYEDL